MIPFDHVLRYLIRSISIGIGQPQDPGIRLGATMRDGVVAFAGVVGAIRGDRADLLISGGMVKEFGRSLRIADGAAGVLYGVGPRPRFIHAPLGIMLCMTLPGREPRCFSVSL